MVTVVGEESVSIPVPEWDEAGFEVEERRSVIKCASGDVTRGVWAGIPVLELIDAAAMPDETTHLQVAGTDGFCACVEVVDVLDGLVAFERTDVPSKAMPRLIGERIDGTRTVQEVRNIVALWLDPAHDREEWETMPKKSSSDVPETAKEDSGNTSAAQRSK
ncbi:MAG: DMSO/TMAO reductase YedYZ molybdopterin-dependent catalytic subunit [Halobacteriales archaeon]|jgi:DMSO/TMAO reductase YedYZ molybdopterin-dependent catalytic subunit